MLSNTNSFKAPGPSGIQHILIKKASSSLHTLLLLLYNICLSSSNIPDEWKNSNIILIPKPCEWEGNLDLTRPITLIETARKGLSSILTKRVTDICKNLNILQGNNFSVLKNTSTTSPIHIINSLLEDAREKHSEIWCTFQDMRRAYDSVSWQMLELAMIRIKMNPTYITLCKNIHIMRQNQILTEYELTSSYPVMDGLDQGEVNAPILWRIFYDPLLCLIKIHHASNGYSITAKWTSSIL